MKFSAFFSACAVLSAVVQAAPISLRKRGWDWESETIRGVNLGGLFVLEPYMSPSLFEAFGDNPPVDEYHYCQELGSTEAASRLKKHWSTWIVEGDIKAISEAGLNWVRIPIGYWAFQRLDGDPYVDGQLPYLNKILDWCRTYGLKAILDLHGAPGSQNGFDNSGLRDAYGWQTDNNVQVTLDVLTTMAQTYGGDEYGDVVYVIELVNEPLGPVLDMSSLITFYENGYTAVRDNTGHATVAIHDAFQADGYFDNVLNTDENSNVANVIVDHHHYQVFSTGELQRSDDDRLSTICSWGAAEGAEYHWSIVGEFSAALTDCAKWLNGASRGARYDGTYQSSEYIGSCDSLYTYHSDYWTDDVISHTRKYVEAQMDAFENGKIRGWFFWSWKTEGAVEWDFQRLLKLGAIPQPLTDRQYPNQCNF